MAGVVLTCDATVASAAPRHPQSAVNMSNGASSTLMKLQARVPQRGVFVSPSPLYTPCTQPDCIRNFHCIRCKSSWLDLLHHGNLPHDIASGCLCMDGTSCSQAPKGALGLHIPCMLVATTAVLAAAPRMAMS